MKKKKKALITGGCGFVGSHMVDLLLENDFEVIVVDNLVGGRLSNLDHHKKNNLLSIEEIDILNLRVGMKMLRDVITYFTLQDWRHCPIHRKAKVIF